MCGCRQSPEWRLSETWSQELALDLKPDSQPDLELLNLAVLNPASFIGDLKPFHVAYRLRRFGDSGLRRLSEAHGRSSYQFGYFVCVPHVQVSSNQKFPIRSLRLTRSKANTSIGGV